MATTKKKRITKKKVARRAARSRPSKKSSRQIRGAAGRDRVDDEIKRQKEAQERRRAANSDPFRVYLKPDTTEREVVILDDEPEFFRHEHQIYNGGKRDLPMYTYCGCVKEWETCAACEEIKESYYALFLTVLDLTPFKTRKKETVEFSRKLMCVKPQQQKKFIRRWKKEGSLRGQVLLLSRDGDKDPVIGNDIEFDVVMEEEELLEYTREWTDAKKKVHVENCSEVYDYDKLFPEADAEQVSAIVGGQATPGSSRQAKEELDDDDFDDDEEDAEKPWDEEEDEEEEEETPKSRHKKKKTASKKKKKKRPSRRRPRDEEEDEEEEEDDEDLDEDENEDEDLEDEEDEEEEEDEEDEEEEPVRTPRKKKKKRTATARRRR